MYLYSSQLVVNLKRVQTVVVKTKLLIIKLQLQPLVINFVDLIRSDI